MQHSCRLIGGKRTSKPDEQRDAMYNPRNVGLKPQECSLAKEGSQSFRPAGIRTHQVTEEFRSGPVRKK